MLGTLASRTAVALATLLLALTLTTMPAVLALGVAGWVFAAVLTGVALRGGVPEAADPGR